jgi:hypothetical protein
VGVVLVGKRVHPIRKLSRQLWGKNNWDFLDEDERKLSDRVIAHHVKPLLAALAGEHLFYGTDGTRCPKGHAEYCDVCRLLDAWETKL